jgi:hypothetical protein
MCFQIHLQFYTLTAGLAPLPVIPWKCRRWLRPWNDALDRAAKEALSKSGLVERHCSGSMMASPSL